MSINRESDKEDVVHIYIYTMEYYSAVTKNEIPLGATRMSPEIMMLSKLDKTNIV